jgi:quinol monooxygenase YgiN
MPSVIATLKVKEDKLEEARSFLKQLAADTLAEHSANLKAAGARFAAVLAGPPEIVLLEEV